MVPKFCFRGGFQEYKGSNTAKNCQFVSLGKIQLLLLLCESQVVENMEQRTSLSLEEAKSHLERHKVSASLESGKRLRHFCKRGLQLPLSCWLLLNSASGMSLAEPGVLPLKQTSYCWFAALRLGLGENMQAARLPLCSATNTGDKRHVEMLPNAAKNPSSRGAKNWVQNWFHVQILGPCVVCICKALQDILFTLLYLWYFHSLLLSIFFNMKKAWSSDSDNTMPHKGVLILKCSLKCL